MGAGRSARPTSSASTAVEDRLHVHDLHATILHLMGVDHSRLVFRHQGRPERPTLNEGNVFERIRTG